MKVINKTIIGIISVCLLMTSCANGESNSSQEKTTQEAVEPGTFDSFLELFRESESFDSWDEKVVDVVGGIGGVYDPEEIQNKTLRENFTEIRPEFHHFMPILFS